MKSKTTLVALFGFLTALCGLLQVMWTEAPWWVKDNDPPRMMIPKAGDPVVALAAETTSTPLGYYVIAVGVIAGVSAIVVKLILRYQQKRREKQMLA